MEEYKDFWKIITKISNSNNDFSLENRLSFSAASRIILESLCETNFPKENNIKDHTKRNSGLNIAWQELSKNLHSKILKYLIDKNKLIYYVLMSFKYFDKNKIFKLKDINLEPDMEKIKLIKQSSNQEYIGLIIQKKWPNNSFPFFTYVLARVRDNNYPYKQKTFREVYSIKNLSKDSIYEWDIWKAKRENSDDNINIEFAKSVKMHYIRKSIMPSNLDTFLDKFYSENNLSVIDILKLNHNNNEKIKEELKMIFSTMNEEEKFKSIMCLKYMDKQTINTIFVDRPNSIQYEFWTKNSRGKSLGFHEKEALNFLGLANNKKDNQIFYNKLLRDKKYLAEFSERWVDNYPDNSKFSADYNQKQIKEYEYNNTKYLTTVEFRSLFDLFTSFRKKCKYKCVIGNAGVGKSRKMSEEIKLHLEENKKYILHSTNT